MNAGRSEHVQAYAARVTPGDDLRKALEEFARRQGISAGVMVTCVGSLARAVLRMAGKTQSTELLGDFEIVALVGTLSPDGPHLHLCIADDAGRCAGGHMQEGCVVRTTAEVVIAELKDLAFRRETDAQTTFKELVIDGPGRLSSSSPS